MVKKVSSVFSASIVKNQSKGGAWLASISIFDEGMDNMPYDSYQAAWSNASAAKRWIKEVLLATTPRKSVKMLPGSELDAKEKPVTFAGAISFKRNA
jgi:hypothetical protein